MKPDVSATGARARRSSAGHVRRLAGDRNGQEPYQDTGGYGHAFPRVEVLEVAERWADASARVVVYEAVPRAGELGPGWRPKEITHRRQGAPGTY